MNVVSAEMGYVSAGVKKVKLYPCVGCLREIIDTLDSIWTHLVSLMLVSKQEMAKNNFQCKRKV